MDGLDRPWIVGSCLHQILLAQIYLYKLAAITALLNWEGFLPLFSQLLMTYHGMTNPDGVGKAVQMCVHYFTIRILHICIDFAEVSPQYEREKTTEHKQYSRLIAHVKDNTMLQ